MRQQQQQQQPKSANRQKVFQFVTHVDAGVDRVVEWLYLSTLSRRPVPEEVSEAREFVETATDANTAYDGVLWMLVNRSEFLLIR